MPHAFLQSWPAAIVLATTLATAAILILAAGHDILSRTVPNWMSLAVAILGVAASIAAGRAVVSLAIGCAIFVTAAFCWRRGWMGGADVKLLGAIAIVLPPAMVATFAVAMSLSGAAQAVVYILARRVVAPPRRPRPSFLVARGLRAEQWRISRGGPLPYACAIAFGFLFVIVNGGMP